MYRFPWHLTLVSTNHASSNPGHLNTIKCDGIVRLMNVNATKSAKKEKQLALQCFILIVH